MHLVPDERAHRRPIDEHTVCDAVAGIGEPETVRAWADRFSLLADPGRLSVLLAVHRAGPIAVTDLALATGISESTVSQILRLLRVSGAVTAAKDGRVVRYRFTDPALTPLVASIPPLDVPASEHHA